MTEYDILFKAMAAATEVCGGNVAVSVKAFKASLANQRVRMALYLEPSDFKVSEDSVMLEGKPHKTIVLSYPHKIRGVHVEYTCLFRIDALLVHICHRLGLPMKFTAKQYFEAPRELQTIFKPDTASISRCRHGKQIPHLWLYRYHVATGLPIAELYAVAGLEPEVHHADHS